MAISEVLYQHLRKIRIRDIAYFDSACERLGLTPRIAITRLCKCKHLSADHRWHTVQEKVPWGSSFYYNQKTESTCLIKVCRCDKYRNEFWWQELREKSGGWPEPPKVKHSDAFWAKQRRKRMEKQKRDEAKWIYQTRKISPRDPEALPFKQHKECKIFKCLRCWHIIFPDEDVEPLGNGFAHKICNSTAPKPKLKLKPVSEKTLRRRKMDAIDRKRKEESWNKIKGTRYDIGYVHQEQDKQAVAAGNITHFEETGHVLSHTVGVQNGIEIHCANCDFVFLVSAS